MDLTKSLNHRLSVRGAFGGDQGGTFSKGGRRVSSSRGELNRAQAFQLEKCLDSKALDKVIGQMMSSKVTSEVSTKRRGAKGGAYEYNVDGFAQFLQSQSALGALLFWKDAEEFTVIFGMEEQKNAADKIYQRYLRPGAEFEVMSIKSAMRNKIEAQLSNPSDDMFEQLQSEVYQTMLFELFPRFWEACTETTEGEKAKVTSKVTSSTQLRDVISAQDLEVHLFAEYCRAVWCEDQLVFLLEVGDLRLLFSPSDQIEQASKIYNAYLSEKSETRITCPHDELVRIEAALEAARKEPTKPLDLTLFDKLYDGVFGILNSDHWPTYVQNVLDGVTAEKVRMNISASSTPNLNEIDMTKPSKAAVAACLRVPEHLEALQNAAAAQGVRELVDFCVACQEYALLFSDKDRKPKGEAIWSSYLMPGADLPVNLSDDLIKSMKPKLDSADSDALNKGYNEILQMIANNIYPKYLKLIELKKRDEAEAAKANEEKAAPSSGGCCTVS